MTTLIPRDPYTKKELDLLYPKNLRLQLVQVLVGSSYDTVIMPDAYPIDSKTDSS
ncbi:hypothetical protein FQN54_001276 [Arachnomyces sp. PD_36]|nr:hypothetical protein FQN54_001276 [Arachnomyces sp. PD_36]